MTPETIDQLRTPALLVESGVFDHNLATMDKVLPGARLRPHVKAFKSTAIARRLAADGHRGFCAATVAEVEGMVAAGMGDDLLLANETLQAERLGQLSDKAEITVAIDSDQTLDAAISGGVRSVIVDVEVGLPRCGCSVDEAPRLADRARAAGLMVMGVMGYEGHLMMVRDPQDKAAQVEACMATLLSAHERVGGDIVSGGGTGTFAANKWVTEIQAGSYTLMDTDYDKLGLPFQKALTVLTTVISVSKKGWLVVDGGLKAFAMDHGNPSWTDGKVLFCSDEHTTLAMPEGGSYAVGDKIRLFPAHVDPTVAKHQQMWLVEDDQIRDCWDIDLRHW